MNNVDFFNYYKSIGYFKTISDNEIRLRCSFNEQDEKDYVDISILYAPEEDKLSIGVFYAKTNTTQHLGKVVLIHTLSYRDNMLFALYSFRCIFDFRDKVKELLFFITMDKISKITKK